MTLLVVLGVLAAAVILIASILMTSRHLTESKSSHELAQRLPDGSAINHDSSGGMWAGDADGGGK
jgi:hypothetical protein